jgi:hypothetical protein
VQGDRQGTGVFRTQEHASPDEAAQHREVVGFTHEPHTPPLQSGNGTAGELERLAGNVGDADDASSSDRVRQGMNPERTMPPAGAHAKEDEGSEYSLTTNTGDKAAPDNRVPDVGLETDANE